MVLYPNAKINIGLKVLNKREDGFHNLETLFYPVNVLDVLEIVPSGRLRMFQYGIEYPGDVMDNLCVRAYNILKKDFDISPIDIYLYKKIPVGAGLGGGSSDAAFVLKGLNELFSLGLSVEDLCVYAAKLGSDCPFFIYNKPMLGEGRGELLKEVEVPNLQGYEIELVYPPIFVSTVDAYKGIIPRDKRISNGEILNNSSLLEDLAKSVECWKEFIVNDFETTVFKKYPQLKKYKEELYDRGAVYASMSGSGSAMFGIFKNAK